MTRLGFLFEIVSFPQLGLRIESRFYMVELEANIDIILKPAAV